MDNALGQEKNLCVTTDDAFRLDNLRMTEKVLSEPKNSVGDGESFVHDGECAWGADKVIRAEKFVPQGASDSVETFSAVGGQSVRAWRDERLARGRI